MKWICVISFLALVFPRVHAGDRQQKLSSPARLLSADDARLILGEPAALTDSITQSVAGVTTYRCTYSGGLPEQGKQGNLYFLYEAYDKLSLSEKKYSVTRSANEDNGIILLENVGDEAYFHTDNANFYYIMVRKGHVVISMKVNKITATTSLDEFHQVVKKMAAAL